MTMKEIKKEALKGSLLFSEDFLVQDGYVAGFIEAIEWFLEEIWHNVNIEPSEKKTLVVIESDGRMSQSNFMIGVDIWEDFVKDADIVKWCYKEDIEPESEAE